MGILYAVMHLKKTKVKKLNITLTSLQKTYDDLDNQAKLIIKTDLELHKTQSELDKKIAGLYTLHKISKQLSTTMDESEIFAKISEEHLTELGFDKVIALLVNKDQTSQNSDLVVKLTIGYDENDIKTILSDEQTSAIFANVIKTAKITSSLESKTAHKEISQMLKVGQITSFICAPIYMKEGIIGVLLVGSESKYSPITLGDKEIVSILAAQIGQALENAKLFEETWRSHQDLERKVRQRTKELSQALEAIKVVTQRKSDFVSAVSHELRTPLTSIKGYAALLSAGKLGEVSEGVKQRLEKINKHSDDLSRLINNILDISRIESGRVEMRMIEISLSDILTTLSDLLAPQLKERQIQFVQKISDDAKTLQADKDQLRRVFINLVGNALKFTHLMAQLQ